MKKAAKSLFIAGFALFFLAGCSQGSQNEAKVSAAAGETQKKTSEKTTIDLKNLSPEERSQVEFVAKHVETIIKLNEEASKLYNQIWGVFYGDFSLRINNPFHGANLSLLTAFAKDGLPLRATDNKNCQPAQLNMIESKIVQQGDLKIKAPVSYSLVESGCAKVSAGLIIAEIKEMASEQGSYFQVRYSREVRWIGKSLEFWGMPKLEGDKYVFPKGEQKGEMVCNLMPDSSGGLKLLDCYNLGQDYNNDEFIGFSQITYKKASSENTLVVKGFKMTIGENGALVKTVFDITDNAREATVNVNEKTVAAPAQDLSRKVEKPAAVPGADQVTTTTLPGNGATAAVKQEKDVTTEPTVTQEKNMTSEPAVMSGDQAIDPNQITAEGEIVPLENLQAPEEAIGR